MVSKNKLKEINAKLYTSLCKLSKLCTLTYITLKFAVRGMYIRYYLCLQYLVFFTFFFQGFGLGIFHFVKPF